MLDYLSRGSGRRGRVGGGEGKTLTTPTADGYGERGGREGGRGRERERERERECVCVCV